MNEFEIDAEVVLDFNMGKDFIEVGGGVREASDIANDDYFNNSNLLIVAANKNYTFAKEIEKLVSINQGMAKVMFKGILEGSYAKAYCYKSKYFSMLGSIDYQRALSLVYISTDHLKKSIKYQEELMAFMPNKKSSLELLNDDKRFLHSLEVDILDLKAGLKYLNGSFKEALRLQMEAKQKQQVLLQFAKSHLSDLAQQVEEANMLAKDCKIAGIKLELVQQRIKAGLENTKDSLVEVLSHQFEMLKLSQKAYALNAISDKYRAISLELKSQLRILLSNIKEYWSFLLITYKDEIELVKLMQEIDCNLYNMEKDKLDPKKAHETINYNYNTTFNASNHGNIQIGGTNNTQNLTSTETLKVALEEFRKAISESGLNKLDKDEVDHELSRIGELVSKKGEAGALEVVTRRLNVIEKVINVGQQASLLVTKVAPYVSIILDYFNN